MKIRSSAEFEHAHSRFEAASAAESIADLEEQYAAGKIEPHVYFERKHSLVRLYLKQSTSPRRRRRDDYEDMT